MSEGNEDKSVTACLSSDFPSTEKWKAFVKIRNICVERDPEQEVLGMSFQMQLFDFVVVVVIPVQKRCQQDPVRKFFVDESN